MRKLENNLLYRIVYMVLNILFWIEWIGGAVFVYMLIIATQIRKGFSLQIPISYSPVTAAQIHSRNADFPIAILNTTSGILSMKVDATLTNTSMLLIGYGLVFSVIVFISFQLKKIFYCFKQGETFNRQNIKRINYIATALIIFTVAQWIFILFQNDILTNNLAFKLNLTYDFQFSYLIAGMALFTSARIVKMGYILEEEQQLTV